MINNCKHIADHYFGIQLVLMDIIFTLGIVSQKKIIGIWEQVTTQTYMLQLKPLCSFSYLGLSFSFPYRAQRKLIFSLVKKKLHLANILGLYVKSGNA